MTRMGLVVWSRSLEHGKELAVASHAPVAARQGTVTRTEDLKSVSVSGLFHWQGPVLQTRVPPLPTLQRRSVLRV